MKSMEENTQPGGHEPARFTPWIGAALLAGAAAAIGDAWRGPVLVAVMLFHPLLDSAWPGIALPLRPLHVTAWTALALLGTALVLHEPAALRFSLHTLLLAALPEELFFRGYFMTMIAATRIGARTLGTGVAANVCASMLFALVHGLSRSWGVAGMVIVPSLIFGWTYQRTRDLPLVILIHALSNLVFVMFLVPRPHGIY